MRDAHTKQVERAGISLSILQKIDVVRYRKFIAAPPNH